MEKIWIKNYPKEVRSEVPVDTYKNIPDAFKQSVQKFGDQTAFINMGSELTFKELDETSDEFASFLQNTAGLQKGDRIALQMPNLLQFPVALFGALKAGLVVVNVNPLYSKREMLHQFTDSQIKAIVILTNFAHKLEDVLKKYPIETIITTEIGDMLGWPKSLIVNSTVKYIKKMVPKYNIKNSFTFYEALDIGKTKAFKPIDITPEDLAFLQYTGGTTGVPKGAMLSHKNIISNVCQALEWLKPGLEEGRETVITALPLYHIFSLTVNSILLMTYGATNVLITNPKDISGFVKELSKHKFSIITGVNTLFKVLCQDEKFKNLNFSSLKLSIGGGMALQSSVVKKWKEITSNNLIEGFGLTETSPIAICNPVNGSHQTGSIGLPVPSTNIKIVDNDLNEVPLGERGELCISGPQVMQGYWQRPDETALTIKDGWLYTGDLAIIQPDGFVKIVDRKKDMILVSGFNVFPNEIEEIVSSHPKVLECAAIGVPHKKSGEAVKLFITPSDKSLSKEEILSYCRENLAGYKIPTQVEFKDNLPKTNVGKILKRELKELPSSSQDSV